MLLEGPLDDDETKLVMDDAEELKLPLPRTTREELVSATSDLASPLLIDPNLECSEIGDSVSRRYVSVLPSIQVLGSCNEGDGRM